MALYLLTGNLVSRVDGDAGLRLIGPFPDDRSATEFSEWYDSMEDGTDVQVVIAVEAPEDVNSAWPEYARSSSMNSDGS